jgi:hypothetical protein
MLKRLSSTLRREKSDEAGVNSGSNGTSNGTTNGTYNGTINGTNGELSTSPSSTTSNGNNVNGNATHARRRSTFGFSKNKDSNGNEVKDHSEDRKGVEDMFREFSQILHASRRPLPTQTGDGTYNGTYIS